MDNGTLVEAFKFLNYCQLATSSLVSMRFRNLIQTHRHKLALLYVRKINMESMEDVPHVIEVFNKELSSQEYNDWVIRNQYSKEVPLVDQVACTENSQIIPNGYYLRAYAYYKDPCNRRCSFNTNAFYAYTKLNHENWAVFQHFVRLATDPFIYVDCMRLTYQNDVLNSLSGAVNPNRRLQCMELYLDHRDNTQRFLTWTKNHVRCNQLHIYGEVNMNHDEVLLDFFMTGGLCTFVIDVGSCSGISKAIDNFVQKFMDLKISDQNQLVDTIDGIIDDQAVESLKRNYAKFVVKDERHEFEQSTAQIFKFANNDIEKKLQLTATKRRSQWSRFLIKIDNL